MSRGVILDKPLTSSDCELDYYYIPEPTQLTGWPGQAPLHGRKLLYCDRVQFCYRDRMQVLYPTPVTRSC